MSRPIGSASELERRRCHAVELLENGERPSVISRILGCSLSSLYRWKDMARDGPEGLTATPHPGRPRRMTDAEHQRLERLLLKGAPAHGWKNGLWTAKRVKLLIQREFGIDYHEEHVRKIVKERLGWSSQKPEQRARERDEEAIERWRHWKFPHIKKGH